MRSSPKSANQLRALAVGKSRLSLLPNRDCRFSSSEAFSVCHSEGSRGIYAKRAMMMRKSESLFEQRGCQKIASRRSLRASASTRAPLTWSG